MAQAVILAGGQGERLWPLTHEKFPKYRIRLDGKSSLLQRTYRRLRKLYDAKSIHVVTMKHHAAMIREELPMLSRGQLILEPSRRNTAPAIYLSTLLFEKKFGAEEVISFFPADHWIEKEGLFKKTLDSAIRAAARRPLLVTVGIRPTFPATGYGYIQVGARLERFGGARLVKRFAEKPDRRTARRYLRTGQYLWNAGIFTWRAGVFLEAMEKFAPEITRRLNVRRLGSSYRRLPSVSIDRALLEKAGNIAVQGTCMDWSDIGSWDTLIQKYGELKRAS